MIVDSCIGMCGCETKRYTLGEWGPASCARVLCVPLTDAMAEAVLES